MQFLADLILAIWNGSHSTGADQNPIFYFVIFSAMPKLKFKMLNRMLEADSWTTYCWYRTLHCLSHTTISSRYLKTNGTWNDASKKASDLFWVLKCDKQDYQLIQCLRGESETENKVFYIAVMVVVIWPLVPLVRIWRWLTRLIVVLFSTVLS